MMRNKLFHTAEFRLIALCALVFSISIIILGAIVYVGVQSSLEEQLKAHVEADTAQLMVDYNDDGLEELRHDVRERVESNAPSRLRYTISGPNGRLLFDKMKPAKTNGWERQRTADGYDVLLLTTPLNDGYSLTVGADAAVVVEMEKAVSHTFLIALVAMLALSVAGGALISRRFLHRVEQLKRTAASIGQGSMSARMPLQGVDDEFERLSITINAMLDRIEQLMHDVRYVSTSIAHDLRTPLGVLRQKLEKSPNSTDALSDLDEILDIFASLLRIAEIESRNASVTMSEVHLPTLFDQLCETYGAVAEAAGQHLSCNALHDATVRGDKKLLTQMFVNAIENAINHNESGNRITLNVDRVHDAIVASVSDTGTGIPESEHVRVLKPFHRLDSSRRKKGSGLGLSMIASIAALHHIELKLADNKPGLTLSFIWKA